MRTFYTESDIEDLAARGVRQLDVGAGVFLTDAAQERAEELGIVLIAPDSVPAGKSTVPAAPAKSSSLPNRPRGCQHGPLPVKAGQGEAAANRTSMVDQLVKAVSALKKQGD